MLATCPFADRFRPSPAADTTTTSSMTCDEVAMESVESNIDNANAIMMKFFVVCLECHIPVEGTETVFEVIAACYDIAF